ncbi:hypothetical protein Tco_1080810 [Tanacetum coccineum]|uniref:Uncharacterized protein n=1 Tax=Tanacetum coccineum TaxID=301880 RepID=A0ABQ5HXB0_9ASTR
MLLSLNLLLQVLVNAARHKLTTAGYVNVSRLNLLLLVQVNAVERDFINTSIQVFLDKQVEDMSKDKEIYVTLSHTKKIFANMKREGKGFSGRITPLFHTIMVQTPEEVGEGSAVPTDSHHTTTQPSTSRPQM